MRTLLTFILLYWSDPEICKLHRMIILRMRWVGNIARVGEMILFNEHNGKCLLDRS